MLTIKKIILQLFSWLVIFAMSAMTTLVVWQVFSRYVLNSPSKYAEELATILMIWVGVFGATLGFEKGAHLGVDILTQLATPNAKKFMQYLTWGLTMLFAVIWILGGWIITQKAFVGGNTLKTLPEISRGFVYLPIPLCGVVILFLLTDKILRRTNNE